MGAPPPAPIDFDVEDFERQHRDVNVEEITQTRFSTRIRAPGKYSILSWEIQ
jgi:hypothetical protein